MQSYKKDVKYVVFLKEIWRCAKYSVVQIVCTAINY